MGGIAEGIVGLAEAFLPAATEAIAPAAGEVLAGGAMNILPEAAAFAPSVVGEIAPMGINAGLALEPAFAGGSFTGAEGLGGALSFAGQGGGQPLSVQQFLQDPGAVSGASTGPAAASFSPGANISLPPGISPDATSASAFQSAGPGGFETGPSFSPVSDFQTRDVGTAISQGFDTAAPQAAPGGAGPSLDQMSIDSAVSTATPGASGTPGESMNLIDSGAGKSGSFIDSLTGAVQKNPVGTAIAAGGLGYNILRSQTTPNQAALSAEAAALGKQGSILSSYLQKGTLPPGLQASVDQAVASAKARAISNAAAQGLPTDPARNTALAATLAGIEQNAVISAAQIGQQLLQSGIQESGLSAQIYQQLANLDMTQTQNIGKAIASMAAALSSKPTGGVTLKLA
jgi:hypothetical protein